MRRFQATVAMFLLALVLCSACTQSPVTSRWTLLEALLAENREDARPEVVDALLASGMTLEQISDCLLEGWSSAGSPATGWTIHEHDSVDGRTRPFHVYVPDGHDSNRPSPVIVFLHGGVGVAWTAEEMEPTRAVWAPIADAIEAILVLPHADASATWWSAAGHANVLATLTWVKRHCCVDEDRLFLIGFSDGGSGSLWMALHDPTPWAGFVSLYGTPTVAIEGPYACYPRNLVNRPLRIVNGSDDPLYPASLIYPYVEQMTAIGADVAWASYPTGHDLSFLAAETAHLLAFFEGTLRNPFPSEVVWETADPRVGRCDWVRIDEIGDFGIAESPPVNFLCHDAEILLGIYTAGNSEDGVLVKAVIPGLVAAAAGVEPGDTVAAVDEVTVNVADDIGKAMAGSRPGDVKRVLVVRDGNSRSLSAPVPEPLPIYPQESVTGRIHAVADGNRIDVNVRSVTRFTLFLSGRQFDLSRPLEVSVNGTPSFHGMIEADPRFSVLQTAADLDRRIVYEAKLVIDVPLVSDRLDQPPSS